jgi:acyl-CoA synthetase (AMP-forming)/AMP-acid ligase II
VPTDALRLLAQFEKGKVPPLEHFGMGGAPIPPSLVQRVIDVLGDQVVIPCIYGMTEILPVAFCEGRQKFLQTEGDLLGRPLSGVKYRFTDDFEVQGAGLMKNYLGREAAPWHPTGDLARSDDQGNLIMLARKKNMLIRGNMNIYPSLYEPGLTTLPGVADAVIVGVPDEYSDDQIVLFILPSTLGKDYKGLKALVLNELPSHVDRDALPDAVIVLDKLPVTGRGQKRDMAKLKELASDYLAGERK